MKKASKLARLFALLSFIVLIAIGTSGCGNDVRNIPPDYIGKILTPTGWQNKILEAGQVDIGTTDGDGRGNQLVICEATSVTIKEQFAKPSNEIPEDHRIITKAKVPLAVDYYVQVMVPDDPQLRDSIFAQVSPEYPDKGDGRESWITLKRIYNQFAAMTIRGKIRQIFSQYKDYDDVMSRYEEINKQVSLMIAETFKSTKIPLKLIGGQLSNVKADETVWAAENRKAAADAEVSAIEKIGKAMRENPQYLQKYKWDVLKEVSGKGTTIIVNDSGADKIGYNLPIGR